MVAVAVAIVVVMVVIEGDGWRSAATALVIVVPVGWIRWMDSLFRSLSSKFVERAETVVTMVAVEAVEGEKLLLIALGELKSFSPPKKVSIMDGRGYNLGGKLVFISVLFFFFYLDLYFVYFMMIIIFFRVLC